MNDNIYYIITYVCLDIFSTYTFYRLIKIFFGEYTYYGKHIEFISYSLHLTINLIFYFTLKIPVVLFAVNIIVTFLVTLNYSAILRKRIFAICFIAMLSVCIETIIALITSYESLSPITTGKYFPLASNIMAKLILYFIMLLLSRLSSLKNKSQLPNAYWFSLIVVPTATIYIALILPAKDLTITQILFCILIIFLVNFILIYLYDLLAMQASERTRQLLLEQELIGFQQQLDTMQTNIKYWDRMRHDFTNHVIILDHYLQENDAAKARGYLDEYFRHFLDDRQVKTGVTIIDSIMNQQIRQALSYNIEVRPEVFVPQELTLDPVEAMTIFGSLFSYAIDSAMTFDDRKMIDIHILFKYTMHRLIFTFTISCQPHDTDGFHPTDAFTEVIRHYNGFWKITDDEIGENRQLILTLYLKEVNFPEIHAAN